MSLINSVHCFLEVHGFFFFFSFLNSKACFSVKPCDHDISTHPIMKTLRHHGAFWSIYKVVKSQADMSH